MRAHHERTGAQRVVRARAFRGMLRTAGFESDQTSRLRMWEQ